MQEDWLRDAAVEAKRRSPNLILITLDTVRADALGAYGQPLPVTPAIDRLAREGVLFEQVSTSQPETLPSHSTIFTGLLPYAHGVRANGGFVLSERHTTIAETLREAGYATGAEVAAMVLREKTNITQGFDHYRGPESPDAVHKVVRYTKGPVREETTDIRTAADISKRGIEFIRKHRSDEFFLWLHYFDAHHPYSAPRMFNGRIPSSPYHAEVASADFQVGLVILEVERLGLRDDTLVVVTADHGEGLGDHGEPSHSYLVYDTTMRVPLVFWGFPELPAGRRFAGPARSADIAPTVLELLGQPPLQAVQGVSLAAHVLGDDSDPLLPVYGESTRFNATLQLPTMRFFRRGRWKYIHKVNPELYDIVADPAEFVNEVTRRPEIADRLRGELERLLRSAPPKPMDAQAKIDADTAEQLVALGYVARSPLIEVVDDVESLELSGEGGDPMDRIADVERMSEATGALARKRFADALRALEPVLERSPNSPYVLEMTASALSGLDRKAEAASLLRRAFALDAGNTELARALSSALVDTGEKAEAADVFRAFLDDDPCNEPILVELTQWLRDLARYDELMATLSSSARACPDLLSNLNNYAWALATLPDPDLRDGARAVELAESVLSRSGARDPAYLDTLAAAFAESGNFAPARELTTEALAALRKLGAPAEVLSEVRGHLDRFEADEPLWIP